MSWDFSDNLTAPPAANHQATIAVPLDTATFVPTDDSRDAADGVYQSITRMPGHDVFSFEELRVNDYLHGRGVSNVHLPSGTQFAVPSHGLVRVSITSPTTSHIGFVSSRHKATSTPRYGSKTIKFLVGKEDPTEFVIHESVVTPHSAFVRMALSNDWKEAKERTIPLPEDEPDTFQLYQEWVYTGLVFSENVANTEKDSKEYERLVSAYILSDRLLDSTFKDVVVDCIIHKLCNSELFSPRLTNLVYDNNPAGSTLRRLWQDIYVWSGSPNWLEEKTVGDEVHPEFLLDLSKSQMSFWPGQRPPAAPYIQNPCLYHEHADGTCYRFRSWDAAG